MKKIVVWLLPVLLLMLLLDVWMPWGLPEENEAVPNPAVQEDGSLLVAVNQSVVSRIYTLKNGQVVDIYGEKRLGKGMSASSIARIATDGKNPYLIRVFEEKDDWELVKLTGEKPETLHQGVFDEPMNITGLAVQGDTVWVTGVTENREIIVYEYQPQEGLQLKLDVPDWWLGGAQTAEYDGKYIRVSRVNGDHCFVDAGGAVVFTPDAADTLAPQIHPEGMGWLLCKKTLFVVTLILWLVILFSVMLTQTICRRSPYLAVRLTAVCAEAAFLVFLVAGIIIMVILMQALSLKAGIQLGIILIGFLLLVWGVSLFLFHLFARRMTQLIPALTEQMNAVAQGDVTPREAEPGWDELHQMNRTMQEMCIGLSIRDYEVESTVRSYNRFIPRKLSELLGRASVSEVDLGDSSCVESNIGLFSVCNRDEARNVLEENEFVNFINYSFALFHDSVYENRGYMISNALRLSLMETMFPESPADGVQAGLDFFGRAQKMPERDIPQPEPLLILHRTSFLYGVAGKEERLFPYLSSSEIEFLGGFSRKFHEAGVRIVATEAYWKQIADSGFAGRYIGFVSDGEREACKLYEILNAYSELDRNLRIGYDHRFQEAINLFYHSDFFLARNIFSALLRVCPEDGVARWYLFACERFFNQENTEDIDYRLFSIDSEG